MGRLPKTTRKSKRIAGVILGLIVAGFLTYILFFSNIFSISDVVISNETLENKAFAQEIEKTISSAIGKNILLVDTKELSSKVIKKFPELKTVEVSKSYPDILKIKFEPYALVANIINESKTLKKSYIINAIGQVIKEDYENKDLPYIRVKSDEPINTKEIVIDEKTLTLLLETKTYFEDKFGMKIKEILYKPIAREIHLLTEKGFYIWLDMQKPIDQQLQKLKKTLVKLDIYKENLDYIDLRISGTNGEKIIYKRK